MFGRFFSFLICIGSESCSKYSADVSSDHLVTENVAGNASEGYDIYKSEIYKTIAESIENFEVRDDDLWICTFPRSGTTWTQEMTWLIVNDLDYDGARVPLDKRFPFLEGSTTANVTKEEALKSVENIAKLPSPRFIKTHLPVQLLPRQLREREKKPKIIHVSRNAKDVCVSLYHHSKRIFGYSSGTLEDFSRNFMKDRLLSPPYWDHVNRYFERRGDENMLFLRYEDMKSNLGSQRFLGKELNDQQIKVLEDHLGFKNMQNNSAVNAEDVIAPGCKGKPCEVKFIRKGEVGQWKTDMLKELIKQFDDWIKANSKEQW